MYGISCIIILVKQFKKQDGTYAVKLRVTHNRNQRLYTTGISLLETEWEETQKDKPSNKYIEYADFFENILATTKEEIKNLYPFSFNSLEDNLFFKQKKTEDAITTMEQNIARLVTEERFRTADSYEVALVSIKKYLKASTRRTKLNFQDITVDWLNGYERWLIASNVSPSTIGIYMRAFRVVVNIGIENGFLQTTQNYLDSFEDDTKIKYQNALLYLDDDILNTNLGA